MADQCALRLIKAAADQCAYVKEHCNNQENIKFTHIYYCDLNQNWLILALTIPIFSFMVFHFVLKVADQNLAPAVAQIAKILNLSQTLAGVTIIAFANGAPDVLTAYIAAGRDEGLLMGVGSIFGAGLIMTTFIQGCVIYYSKVLKVNKRSFDRDLVFNFVGITMVIIYAFIGQITRIMAIIFVSFYFVYIGVVLVNEKQDKRDKLERKQQRQLERMNDQQQALLQNQEGEDIPNPIVDDNVSVKSSSQQPYVEPVDSDAGKTFSELTCSKQVYQGYDIGIRYIRRYTIPACDEEEYNKWNAVVHCLICPIICVLLQGGDFDTEVFDINLILILYTLSAILLILVLFEKMPILLVVTFATLCSLIWVQTLIQTMVDFLLLLQVLTEISYTYIGLTFLALGNCIGDTFVNIKFAKMGYGIMAITGCFSGLIFNLFIGFGGALLRLTFSNTSPVAFNLFKDPVNTDLEQLMLRRMNNSIAYFVLFIFMINIGMTAVICRVTKYRFTYNTARYYLMFYSMFFFIITLTSVAFYYATRYILEAGQ